MSNQNIYADRLLKIAAEKAKQKLPNSSKQELLIYQLGFVVGFVAKYASGDISILRDIEHHEEQLGITYKK
jgi:hypothetical protein